MCLDDIDPYEILRAVEESGLNARKLHKQLGHPLVVWRDGAVLHVPPEEIDISPLPARRSRHTLGHEDSTNTQGSS